MDLQPADLQFTTRWMNGHQIVAIAGDIDACTAPAMLAYVLNAAADSDGAAGASNLVMDLSAVTFMDAGGLTALIRADGGWPPRPHWSPGCWRSPTWTCTSISTRAPKPLPVTERVNQTTMPPGPQ
jgi:ABC-type transporter Mla MlaB component